jgi:hypothetical protein
MSQVVARHKRGEGGREGRGRSENNHYLDPRLYRNDPLLAQCLMREI